MIMRLVWAIIASVVILLIVFGFLFMGQLRHEKANDIGDAIPNLFIEDPSIPVPIGIIFVVILLTIFSSNA